MAPRIKQYIDNLIQRMNLKKDHPVASFLLRQIKMILLTMRGFAEANIQLRASALTLYTLLSIVPVLAMIFGIAKGFGFELYLKGLITEQLAEQKEFLNEVLKFVDRYLGNINAGYITGIGFVILLWSVMKMLGNIESSFNNIWRVKKSRMLTRKFTDYISLLIIVPVFIIVASSFTVSQVDSVSKSIPFLSYLNPILKGLVHIISYTLIWFVFTLIYIVIPNTNVKFIPALIAGIIAGTMFQLLQWAYVNFQSYLSGYGAVYGTFAAIPLFLIWLELSWLIVLLGAEISYANQNADSYEHEADQQALSQFNRRVLALLVMNRIIKSFVDGKPAQNAVQLAEQLDIPVRLVREIIDELVNADILSEIMTEDIKEVAYQPSLDPNKITVNYLIDILDKKGFTPIFTKEPKEIKALSGIVESYYNNFKQSSENKLLKDI
ncbi:MAG: YihY/virulence factor BrkB family protein [Bacteroidales bacterium]|nr:YihY/virulence factor BrkB family protein [Bacteroidales bacterium]